MNTEWFYPRPLTSNASGTLADRKFGERTKRRPVGGEDRAPACQKRLGEIRTRRGDGAGLKRAWRPLPLLESQDGDRAGFMKMRFMHAFAAKTHAPRGN